MADSATQAPETRAFQTEVKQLLHLVTHSLYSNKEVFLRELISNAADAADKLGFEALSDPALFEKDPDLKIWVDFDKKARTVTIRDNGIGMSHEEVIEHIGTIAKSGTREYLERLGKEKSKDSNMIGQFGVGFYSAYVVADKVTVLTRRAGMQADQGVVWESDGQGEYTIGHVELPQRGTSITLRLKKDENEFLDNYRLRHIIDKYSKHIPIEIMMKATLTEEEEKENKVAEYEKVNDANALWTLPKSEIKEDDYQELYKHISHDFENPLSWAHNRVEGKLEYTSLLYIPQKAPFDMFNRELKHGLKLYVKRVFIMDDAEQLLPNYLRFVKGVVDSSDLPLNVSREILQDNSIIEKIKNGCSKRVLDLLSKLAKDKPEEYTKFWKEFGVVLKEGPGEDAANKSRIAKLFRFSSTHTDLAEQNVSLEDYVGRMKPDQSKIYYVVAESFNACKNSPHLEVFRKKGIEVLLLNDRIDEWLVAHMNEFDEKQLQSVNKGDIDFDEVDKEQEEELQKNFDGVIKQVQEVLGDRIKEVRLTNRLTDSPACLVTDDNDMSIHLQRMLQSSGHDFGEGAKPILELNPEHPFVTGLQNQQDDAQFKDWALLLFDQSMLAEGGTLEDPGGFVKRMNKLLVG